MRELDTLYSDFTGQAMKLGMSLSFTLENGADLLRPVFPNVSLIPHVDALDVDDADALADYLLSITGGTQAREPLLAYIQARLAALGGRMRIGKDSGMFVARA
jgi:hypothetical protein